MSRRTVSFESKRARASWRGDWDLCSSQRWTGRVAEHDFGIDDDVMVQVAAAAAFRYQEIANDVSDTLARDVNRRQGRVAELGKLDVVEAGYGDVLRHSQSSFAQFTKRTNGHDVVNADDRRRRPCGCQQRPSSLP